MDEHRANHYEINAECDDGVMFYWISFVLIYILMTKFCTLQPTEYPAGDKIS
jgi:hypothetical protein